MKTMNCMLQQWGKNNTMIHMKSNEHYKGVTILASHEKAP